MCGCVGDVKIYLLVDGADDMKEVGFFFRNGNTYEARVCSTVALALLVKREHGSWQ